MNPKFICDDPEVARLYGIPLEECRPDTVGVNYRYLELKYKKDGKYNLPLLIHERIEYYLENYSYNETNKFLKKHKFINRILKLLMKILT